MAEILHVPRDPFNRKVILDKGSQSGIQPGQVVVDDAGVVGQITRNYPWLSEVTLITDKDHSVPVQVRAQRPALGRIRHRQGWNAGAALCGRQHRY